MTLSIRPDAPRSLQPPNAHQPPGTEKNKIKNASQELGEALHPLPPPIQDSNPIIQVPNPLPGTLALVCLHLLPHLARANPWLVAVDP